MISFPGPFPKPVSIPGKCRHLSVFLGKCYPSLSAHISDQHHAPPGVTSPSMDTVWCLQQFLVLFTLNRVCGSLNLLPWGAAKLWLLIHDNAIPQSLRRHPVFRQQTQSETSHHPQKGKVTRTHNFPLSRALELKFLLPEALQRSESCRQGRE